MRSRSSKKKGTAALWTAVAAGAAAFAAITLSSDQPVTRASAATAGSSAAALAASNQAAAPTAAPGTARKQGTAQGSTIFIDPDTGLQRDPTPEELLELSNQRTQSAEAPQPIVSDTGFAGLRLTDDQMMYTVATRRADGTISLDHAAGKKDAEQKVRNLAAGGGLVAGKERVVER